VVLGCQSNGLIGRFATYPTSNKPRRKLSAIDFLELMAWVPAVVTHSLKVQLANLLQSLSSSRKYRPLNLKGARCELMLDDFLGVMVPLQRHLPTAHHLFWRELEWGEWERAHTKLGFTLVYFCVVGLDEEESIRFDFTDRLPCNSIILLACHLQDLQRSLECESNTNITITIKRST
jgi:hypothetical protein